MIDLLDVAETPVGFVEGLLDLPLYDWQAKAITPLYRAGYGKPIVQVTVLAPNEGGKSSRIVAGSSLYWCSVHSKGRVSITTKDQKQLNEQIIPAIEAQLPKLGGWQSKFSPYYRVTTPTGGVIVAYVTDDAARVEGMHGAPGAPLLEIVDEAKSVEERIFDGIDRCGYQALLYCSSGGTMQGTFFKSHKDPNFIKIRAGLKDCPHIPQEKVQRLIDKRGINDPLVRSSVFGEFMEQDEGDQFIFTLSAIDGCRNDPPKHKRGIKVGFCDFADATAEHVFGTRDGNKGVIQRAWHEADKNAAAARFVYEFRKSGLTQEQIWGDAADAEMLALLSDLGWNINRKNFGSKARQDEMYLSWSAEAWIETALMVLRREIIVPDDDILVEQLTSRKKEVVGRGKWAAEEKYDMRRRGIMFLDRADVFCGLFNVSDAALFDTKQPFSIPDGLITRHGGWEGAEEFAEQMGASVGL